MVDAWLNLEQSRVVVCPRIVYTDGDTCILPNGREQPPVFTDHPALGAGAEVWQWNRLVRRMVAPQSSVRRRHTGGSAAGPSSQTLYHSGGRGYAPHTRWGSVSVFRVQGADPWLSSMVKGLQ